MSIGKCTYYFDRCLDDVDDEVRDRAALYLKVFQAKPLADTYVKEGDTACLMLGGSLLTSVQSPFFLWRL